ncbi:MAG: DUF4351 domain-containing protein [Symploca sp. SIO2E9]|nr:DUF4351 domain-containing protein [Symploca sp. SIO2E9]
MPEEAERQRADKAQQQGLRQGALRQLLVVLETRFGSIPSDVEQDLQALELEQLEELVKLALQVNSWEELKKHL